jgi:hypothetical protein
VRAHDRARPFGVAIPERGDDLAVVEDAAPDPRPAEQRMLAQHERQVPERLDRGDRIGFPGRPGAESRRHCRAPGLQRLDPGRSDLAGGMPGREAFGHGAQCGDLVELVAGPACDARARVRLAGDEALGFEPARRVADRREAFEVDDLG